jgi:hypothetical protein
MDTLIYQTLSDALAKKSLIKLANTYRGIPLTDNAQMIEFSEDVATFHTGGLQIICARNQKMSYLNFGSRILRATLLDSDLVIETITYTHFEISKSIIGYRKLVRVEPELPIKIQLTSPRFNSADHEEIKWFDARLVEISIRGAGILFHNSIIKQMPALVNDPATLSFDLPVPLTGEPVHLEVNAIFRNIRPFDDNFTRIGLETFPDPLPEQHLSNYVIDLQKNIIRGLEQQLKREQSAF